MPQYAAILGREVVGRSTAVGRNAKGLKVGQRVGIGWASASCMHCHQCMSGSHHLCPQAQATFIGHRGGFASHIRAHWAWAIPLPERLNFADAGPLLCGGITVFAPLARFAKPSDRVGIIGIGGLGHMAVKFAAAYGCDVTAFTSSASKFDEARGFGANSVVSSKDSAAIGKLAGNLSLTAYLNSPNVPQAQQSLPLSSPSTKDLELPINVLAERVAFQVATSQPGAWFRLQKFTPSVRVDPWSPVRGVN